MNLVFIYLGEECLVIIYSASELAMGIFDVILQPDVRPWPSSAPRWIAIGLEAFAAVVIP